MIDYSAAYLQTVEEAKTASDQAVTEVYLKMSRIMADLEEAIAFFDPLHAAFLDEMIRRNLIEKKAAPKGGQFNQKEGNG